MDRRSWIKKVWLLAGGGLAAGSGQARAKSSGASGGNRLGTIILYCDLAVKPDKEQQMLHVFHDKFRPAAEKFNGFIDLKILKYDHLVQGKPLPTTINYRFELAYESLALQQIWVHSPTHQALWPLMAETLNNPDDFQVLVFNNA
jgi:hypothetical protein